MKTDDFDYTLPLERIAQAPVEPRHASRLLVMDRASGALRHAAFWDLTSALAPGDILVLNQTRVILARLHARKLPGGGRVELLLLRREDAVTWEALGGGKGLHAGRRLELDDGPQAEIVEVLDGPRRRVRFSAPVEAYLPGHGNGNDGFHVRGRFG